jgi:hypothetical protein
VQRIGIGPFSKEHPVLHVRQMKTLTACVDNDRAPIALWTGTRWQRDRVRRRVDRLCGSTADAVDVTARRRLRNFTPKVSGSRYAGPVLRDDREYIGSSGAAKNVWVIIPAMDTQRGAPPCSCAGG